MPYSECYAVILPGCCRFLLFQPEVVLRAHLDKTYSKSSRALWHCLPIAPCARQRHFNLMMFYAAATAIARCVLKGSYAQFLLIACQAWVAAHRTRAYVSDCVVDLELSAAFLFSLNYLI